MNVDFKTELGAAAFERLKTEWEKIDPFLRLVVSDLGDFTFKMFGKKPIITCLFRTPVENTNINGSAVSAHLSGRAADIRATIYSGEELVTIQKYIKHRWGSTVHIITHPHGTGPHIHINTNWVHRPETFTA